MPDGLTVRQALAQSGLAPVDAQVLLACVLARDRGWLIAHATDSLANADIEAFFALARRRRDGEPVAYLTGRREFWDMSLAVDASVLIPRPETETLVECALRKLPVDRPVRVLDLGTGSGAIALAIARERPHATVWATDRSKTALDVARANAHQLDLERVQWVESDWYRALAPDLPRFDLIASNPAVRRDRRPAFARGRPALRASRCLDVRAGRSRRVARHRGRRPREAGSRRLAGRRAWLRPSRRGPRNAARCGVREPRIAARCRGHPTRGCGARDVIPVPAPRARPRPDRLEHGPASRRIRLRFVCRGRARSLPDRATPEVDYNAGPCPVRSRAAPGARQRRTASCSLAS